MAATDMHAPSNYNGDRASRLKYVACRTVPVAGPEQRPVRPMKAANETHATAVMRSPCPQDPMSLIALHRDAASAQNVDSSNADRSSARADRTSTNQPTKPATDRQKAKQQTRKHTVTEIRQQPNRIPND